MADDFSHDVFLSYSSKDQAVVMAVAKRLRRNGLRVWLDFWEVRPGDNILAKIEEGLENSKVLLFFMSGNAFGSDWGQLEVGIFRFRDPLNRERRLIPLRLDNTPIKGSLAQYCYIDWRPMNRNRAFVQLLEACKLFRNPPVFAKTTCDDVNGPQNLASNAISKRITVRKPQSTSRRT